MIEPEETEESASPLTAHPSPVTERTWHLISLVPGFGREPMGDVGDAQALATWVAESAPWHPAILSRATDLPRVEDVDYPTTPGSGEAVIVAEGYGSSLPSGFRTNAEDIGAVVIDTETDRFAVIRRLLERIDPGASAGDPDDPIALDFLALGTMHGALRDTTIGMGHVDCLDADSLSREALAGARAWRSGDISAASGHLRACFELLTQAREKFYPVDGYIIDLCLLDPSLPVDSITETLASRTPVSFVATASAIDGLANRDPGKIAAILEGVNEGWIDVVGGTFQEADEGLLPLESILWQFRKGIEAYRRHLDDRSAETLAQRRFALYPQRPQIARRFGFRYAVHLALDAGKFPVRPEAKRLWESPDGTTLESLTRPPIGADRPSSGLLAPWKLAKSMRDDMVATLPLVHWPAQVAGWYRDWRRSATYSPVLVRWTTLGDYFHLTDRPFETFRPGIDEYVTPYLSQAASKGLERPISARAEHARLRSKFDGTLWLRAMAGLLGATEAEGPNPEEIEDALESGRPDEAKLGLEELESSAARSLAGRVVGTGSGERPGYLILNPSGVARRAIVTLPDAAADLAPEGPLRAVQLGENGVIGVVELPAFGFAWVPRSNTASTATNPLSAKGRILKNEAIEVEVDEATGGLRSIRGVGDGIARLGQQLVIAGLTTIDGQPAASRMKAEGFEVEYAGPALVQAVSKGILVDPLGDRTIARFRQRFRLWSGRPTLEIAIEFDEIDAPWLARASTSDPWTRHIACRWAWPDSSAALRRSSLLGMEETTADRPETPDVLDISTRRQRTALLFGGLAHHRKHGSRMLDTILVAGRETGRSFQLGVALDLEHPHVAAIDFLGEAVVVPVENGPPRSGPTGWFSRVDGGSVAVTRVATVEPAEGRSGGLAFDLIEAAGQASRCRLRLFRNPASARQVDFLGDLIVDLSVDGDAVLIDLTPHELARVEVAFGGSATVE